MRFFTTQCSKEATFYFILIDDRKGFTIKTYITSDTTENYVREVEEKVNHLHPRKNRSDLLLCYEDKDDTEMCREQKGEVTGQV